MWQPPPPPSIASPGTQSKVVSWVSLQGCVLDFGARPRLRPGFPSKAAPWHRVAMLLRFVEARLKTLEHVRQRDGVKDDSTAGLLERKLATYKLGVDEAAAVNAAIIDSNALTPACIDACVSTINENCDLAPPQARSQAASAKSTSSSRTTSHSVTGKCWRILQRPLPARSTVWRSG